LRVFVYYNLNRHCLSVRAMDGEHAHLVIAHATSVQLGDVNFRVSAAGRARVLRERRKNVHAGLVGQLQGIEAIQWLKPVPKGAAPALGRVRGLLSVHRTGAQRFQRATYDPYRFDSFVDAQSHEPVEHSESVDVLGRQIIYTPSA
jgi:hypothetical protein